MLKSASSVKDLIKCFETKTKENAINRSYSRLKSTENLPSPRKNNNPRLESLKWQTLQHVDEDVKKLAATATGESIDAEDFVAYVQVANEIVFLFNELAMLESYNNKAIEEKKKGLAKTLFRIHFDFTKPFLGDFDRSNDTDDEDTDEFGHVEVTEYEEIVNTPTTPITRAIYREEKKDYDEDVVDMTTWPVSVRKLKELYECDKQKVEIKPNFKIERKVFANDTSLTFNDYMKLQNMPAT